MSVHLITADIFAFAPVRCDGMAIWFHRGFNTLSVAWEQWRNTTYHLQVNLLRDGDWIPEWNDNPPGGMQMELPAEPPHESRIFRLSPPTDRLKYIYVHGNGNPNDDTGAPTEQVIPMTFDALAKLDLLGCRSVAMNGIWGNTPGGAHNVLIDRRHGPLILQASRDWADSPGRNNIQDIYLVDLKGDFGPAE